jgi:ABC-type phosphate transport system substrate-binding protein
MWNIIYYAIKNLAALAQEGTYTRQHIYNMIPGSIRRYADYRLAKDEEIRPWRRPSLTTESWITSILLDKVLKGGDVSFETLKGQDVVGYVERLLADPADVTAA